MKKNLFSKMIMALIATLAFSACTGKNSSSQSPVAKVSNSQTAASKTTTSQTTVSAKSDSTKSDSAKSQTLNDVYAKMKSDVTFPTEMLKMDDEYLEMQFGFNSADFEEYVYVQGEDTLLAETILLIKVKDAKNVASVKEMLENYVFDQTTLLKSYVPEQGKIAEKSVVVANGKYVYMLMSSQVAALKKIAADMIK